MSFSRWTSGLWVCALLCLQAPSTWAAEPVVLPVQPRGAAALTPGDIPPDMALPYGAGYEKRQRAAGSQNEPNSHTANGASQAAGASRGGAVNGSSGGTGRGNGGRGR